MDSLLKAPSSGGAFAISWLGCDEQPPQPPALTFEERQEEFMATRFPRLWEAFRMSDIKSLIEEHEEAERLLYRLHQSSKADYLPEILEKRRIIRRLREMIHESEK